MSSRSGFTAWFRGLGEASKVAFVVALITATATLLAAAISGGVAVYTASRTKGTPSSSDHPAIARTSASSSEPSAPPESDTSPSPPGTSDNSAAASTPPSLDPQQEPASADLKVKSVDIELSDTYKVGNGLYELGGRKTINLRFWWTTVTNYGPIESGDKTCTVIATMTTRPSNKLVDTYRTANCTFSGWVEMSAPQGIQSIDVEVTLGNGSRGTGSQRIRVIP